MSRDPERSHRMTRLLKMAQEEEVWSWNFADELVAEVEDRMDDGFASPSSPGSHSKNGAYEIIDDIASEFARAGLEVGTKDRLRQIRATALAWPEDERRIDEATFSAHLATRGSKDDLGRFIRTYQHDRKTHNGSGWFENPRLTQHRVAFYRADARAPVAWNDQLRRRLRSLVKWCDKYGGDAVLDSLGSLLTTAIREHRQLRTPQDPTQPTGDRRTTWDST